LIFSRQTDVIYLLCFGVRKQTGNFKKKKRPTRGAGGYLVGGIAWGGRMRCYLQSSLEQLVQSGNHGAAILNQTSLDQSVIHNLLGGFLGQNTVDLSDGIESGDDGVLGINLELDLRDDGRATRVDSAHHSSERGALVVDDDGRGA
jgi:hypothetical protein